jgi:hypothetical protein
MQNKNRKKQARFTSCLLLLCFLLSFFSFYFVFRSMPLSAFIASAAHTATINVIINNTTIILILIFQLGYPVFFFDAAKVLLFAHTDKKKYIKG